jgi:tetratricopeptide (TPR) repeat protein
MKSMKLLSMMLLASAIAWAQTSSGQANPPQTPAAAQGATPQTQSGAPGQASSTAQAAQPNGHRMLQAKSQDELKAYQDAASKTDPSQAEAAANDFAAKFPDSELRAALYMRVMNMYAQANNSEKVVEIGRKAIAADPINPVPLMEVASTLAETTRDTDLDREQRLAEAAKDAHAAIENVDTGLLVPANADPERVAGAKRTILTNSYDTLAMVDMGRNDYGAAVTNLQKALDESKGNPDAVLYLRLSVAQDKLQQYPQALDSANKAVQYSKDGTAAQNLAKQQQERLQKLIAGSQGTGAAAPMSPAPNPAPQANPATAPGQPTTPH